MAAVPPNPWSAGSPSVGGSAALPVGATTALPVGALAGAASDSPLRRRRDRSPHRQDGAAAPRCGRPGVRLPGHWLRDSHTGPPTTVVGLDFRTMAWHTL